MKKSEHTIKKKAYVNYVLMVVALSGLTYCSSQNNTSESTSFSNPTEHAYTLTTKQFTANNMSLVKMEQHNFNLSIKTNGLFDVPPQNRVSISAYFGGYVRDINLLPGEKVKKGQVLFILENPDYIHVQQDFLEAKNQLQYLKSNYERQKNLIQDQITSQKNYLKAEADYIATRVQYEALKKKLKLMNINTETLREENLRTTTAVVAPINGYITHVNVNKGTYLNPADVALSILDTDHLHLELIIFEKDIAAVKIGQPIKFKIQNDNYHEYDAIVYLINKFIDPEKRTVMIHGHLVDEKNTKQFIPGMYVEAEIHTSSMPGLALPQEAVVNIEDKYFVLMKTRSNTDTLTFKKRHINIGKATEGYVEILNHEEFKKNEEFLSNGAFNLINE